MVEDDERVKHENYHRRLEARNTSAQGRRAKGSTGLFKDDTAVVTHSSKSKLLPTKSLDFDKAFIEEDEYGIKKRDMGGFSPKNF